jgi:DNA-binding MltR family transcriptional regulator
MADDSKPKTLKDLRKEIPSTNDVMSRLAAAQRASDYEAAILSASLLEYMLMQAIVSKLIPLGRDHLNSLFFDGGNAPLSTFSAKIKLSYALGIVSSETRLQIERVNDLRNHFAHHKDRASFDEESVKVECSKFKQFKGIPEDMKNLQTFGPTPKLRYVQTCFLVCVYLINYINFIGTPTQIHTPIDLF